MHFVDVDVAVHRVTAGRFLDMSLQLADVPSVNFRVDDVALLRHFRPGSGA